MQGVIHKALWEVCPACCKTVMGQPLSLSERGENAWQGKLNVVV